VSVCVAGAWDWVRLGRS